MIPETWSEGRVGDLIEKLESGVSVNGEDRPLAEGESGVLRVSAVTYGVFDPSSAKAILSQEASRSKCNPRAGQIIISRSNTDSLVGASAYIDKDYPNLYLSDKLWQTIPKTNVVMRWLSYILASDHTRYLLSNLATGTSGSMKNITKSELLTLKVSIPPLFEQERIARVLSTWDEAITTTERLIEASQQQKRALMQQLLTGKRRLPGFEGEWEEFAISQMGKVVSGGTPETNEPSFWDGDVLWMTPTDVTALKTRFISDTKRKITIEGVKNSSATILPPGVLLVCTRATVGLMSISTTEITTNQGFKSLVPSKRFDVNFLFYLLGFYKNKFIRYSCGSTFLEISKKDFSKMKFACPRLIEQQAIATVLATADSEIETLQKKLGCLKQEKKALMQQLLTGKRRVKVEEKEDAIA